MKRSTEHILTTHTGSLPRPAQLTAALVERDRGGGDRRALAGQVRDGVREVVGRQVQAGILVANDGEASKIGYSTYVAERLDGFGGEGEGPPPPTDATDFPEFWKGRTRGAAAAMPVCVGPVSYRDLEAVRADIANLESALAEHGAAVEDVFMTAASPGVIALFLRNRHYPDHEQYIGALADAMKVEYDEIHRAGFVLQLDCPDLAAGRHLHGETLDGFRRRANLHLEALDRATRDIPSESLRLHVCWGNYEGPHLRDVPLRDIVDLLLEARPAAISFEAANPRHEHEWTVFRDVRLPDGKILIPGVLDSTTNYVEHPELIAQRIERYADLVGRDNLIAGSDCGFATFAASPTVHPTVVWAKLGAMAEGARIASDRLWRSRR